MTPMPTTDPLVTATWALDEATVWLVIVGALALIATVIAAYFAYRAFRLESDPNLVISRTFSRAADVRQIGSRTIEGGLETPFVFRYTDESDTQEVNQFDEETDPRFYVEFRNAGRAPLLQAVVAAVVEGTNVPPLRFEIPIGAVPANGAVAMYIWPFTHYTEKATFRVESASHAVPSFAGASKRRAIAFVSEQIPV
jgi:hypothetical protein